MVLDKLKDSIIEEMIKELIGQALGHMKRMLDLAFNNLSFGFLEM
jgi:hypothetical protein